MRGLRVTVQASDYKVDHDPVEQHHARANDGQHRGPHALVFATPTRVYQQREHNKSVQREYFFGVPTPRASPTVIGPNSAHGNARPQQDERKFHQRHGDAVQDFANAICAYFSGGNGGIHQRHHFTRAANARVCGGAATPAPH